MDLRDYEVVALGAIKPHPKNAKQHDLEAIQSSLQEFGQTEPLIVSRETGYILAGNGRHKGMRLLGWSECHVIYLDDLTPADELRALAIHNRTAELGRNDPHRLHLLLEAIREDRQGLTGTGYSEKFADRLAEAQRSSVDRTAALFGAAGIDPMKPATFKIPCTQGQAQEMLDRLQRYCEEHDMQPGEALHEILTQTI